MQVTTEIVSSCSAPSPRPECFIFAPMILVTGGTGMIGACLLSDLAREGKQVRALKRAGSSMQIFELYFSSIPELRNKIEWVEADLLDLLALEEALQGIDTVYHCAAMISFIPEEAALMEKTNIDGTANLVNLCLDLPDFRYFAHVSSVATLGRKSGEQYLDENAHWESATNPSRYAISKYGAEREVWRGIAEGLPAVIVNPSIVLGPGDWKKGSVALFHKVKTGFPFYTEGISGFTDVRDVSAALLHLHKQSITGERYIISAENISFKTLFDKIAARLGVKAPSVKVSSWMSSIVWPLEKIRCMVTGSKPFITKETARSANSCFHYKSDKLIKTGFTFRSVDETIDYTCTFLAR